MLVHGPTGIPWCFESEVPRIAFVAQGGITWLNFWMILAGGISLLITSIAGYIQSLKNADLAQKSADAAAQNIEEVGEVKRLVAGRIDELFKELNEARLMIEAVETNRRKFERILYELQAERTSQLMKEQGEDRIIRRAGDGGTNPAPGP